MPHNYPLNPEESLINVRLLSKDAKKEAKTRIKALEKRDNDKLKTDEAKNEFESLIYEFRAWLNEDENHVYETADIIEELIKEVNNNEEWLDDASNDVGYKEFQTKSYGLAGSMNKLKIRKSEHIFRTEQMSNIFENLNLMKTNLP